MTVLPHDLAVEDAVIGCLLNRPQDIADVATTLGPEDFYKPTNGTLYALLVDAWRTGEPHGPATLAAASSGILQAGDAVMLAVNGPAGCRRAVERLIDMRIHRDVIQSGADIMAIGETVLDGYEAHEQATARLATVELPTVEPRGLWDLDAFMDRPESETPWVVPGMFKAGWRVVVVATEGAGKALDIETPILTSCGWATMADIQPGDVVYAPDGKPTNVVACSQVQHDRDCYRVRFDDGTSLVADADHLWSTVDYNGRSGGQWIQSVRSTVELRNTLHARRGHTVNHAIGCAAPPLLPVADLPVPPYVLGAWLGDGNTSSGGFTCADSQIIDEIRAAGYSVEHPPSQSDGIFWQIGRTTEYIEALARADNLYLQGELSARHTAERTGVGYDTILKRAQDHGVPISRRPMVRARNRGIRVPVVDQTFSQQIRRLGLFGNKHIPSIYLLGSFEQRLALLQGLMDTDGSISDGSGRGRGQGAARCELSFMHRRLSADAHSLCLSLGIKATIRESDATLNGSVVGRRWRIGFQTTLPVFRLHRKRDRQQTPRTRRALTRYIVGIEPVPSRPVRCIKVDHPDALYLAGRELIATHNTTMARQIATAASSGIHPFMTSDPMEPIPTLMIDLENPADAINETGRRMRAAAGTAWGRQRVSLWHRPGGINIRRRQDRGELEAILKRTRPALVTIGPLYKLYVTAARESDEQVAAEVQGILDDLRTRFDFALLLEHHAPKADGSQRPMSPYGSSLWLRWPELGLKLTPCPNGDGKPSKTRFKVGTWRDHRVRNRWPDRIEHGQVWPWIGEWDQPYRTQTTEEMF